MNRLNRRRFLVLSSAGAASAVLVACGNEAPTAEDLNPTQIPDVAGAPPTLAPLTEAPESSGGGEEQAAAGEGEEEAAGGGEQAAAGGGGTTHVVEMNDQLQFVPDSLTINVGDTVTWVTVGAAPHTSTADPDQALDPEFVKLPEGAETWDSGLVNTDEEFSHTFEVPGEYVYFCTPHQTAGMVASLTVVESGAGGGDASATPAEEEEAAASPEGEQAAASGGGTTHVVEMNDQLKFDPEELTIKVGDTVTWRTVGAAPHTSTADPDQALQPDFVKLPEGAETWDSGMVTTDQEFSHTFEVAGEYTYFCTPHQTAGMVASLTVEE